MNPLGQVERLALTHLLGIGMACQNLGGLQRVKAALAGNPDQHFMRSRTLAVGKVRLQQALLQGLLHAASLKPGPMQQAMGVKGVVDAAAPAAGLVRPAEGKADLFTALANVFPVDIGLLGRDAVLFGDVLGNFLAFGRHLRIELERLEVQLGRDVAGHARQRLVQRFQADGAPGA